MNSIDSIKCDQEFDLEGKQFGNIELSFSDNKHAFSKIQVPIITIKNGSGPTLLLSAGNHGDEYEGQVILRRMIDELSPADINGRLIILPALNYPAVLDNARVSPLDQGNMNRSFPGVEGSNPTSAIAHFVTTTILPLADAGIDLHSGGGHSYYLPCTYLCTARDPEITKQNLALVEAFNAPNTLVVRGENATSGFDPVAHNCGVPFISTELSGGANVDIGATAMGMQGVKNVMHHLGIIDSPAPTEAKSRYLNAIDGSYHLSAPYSGIFEPYRALGEEIAAGDVAGVLYSVEEVERPPLELSFDRPGIIMVRRNGARVCRGGHLFLVCSTMKREDVMAIT
jgi:predicted deacylase